MRIFAAMVYKVIGLMSGSSLDGLDLVYVHLQYTKNWEYTLINTACYPYPKEWRQALAGAPQLSALGYQLLHTEYGHYLGEQVRKFIEEFGLHYKVQLVVSHGHTAFHWPGRRMTAQLGDGAAIAAETRINVVSDLRSMDLALGGQGAPIVPIGEKLLLPGYEFFLNLGGIANVSGHQVAFDVCPANRVLNALAETEGKLYDEDGVLAAGGEIHAGLLHQLNALPYYDLAYPKSLDNEFGTETVLPLIRAAGLSTADALRTYVEHLVTQIARSIRELTEVSGEASAPGTPTVTPDTPRRMLVTGGGAHNSFLIEKLKEKLPMELVVPDAQLADYKEALIMALIGVLRWREEYNVLSSVTGASRDSIGGAVWIGQDA